VRVIQKYPNRRLYDKTESRYITLDDIRSLVLNGYEFAVHDQRSSTDITRATLLQVLTAGEESANSNPVLNCEFLKKAIRVQSAADRRPMGQSIDLMKSLESRSESVASTREEVAVPAI